MENVSRRGFLAGGLAAAASLGIGGALAGCSPRQEAGAGDGSGASASADAGGAFDSTRFYNTGIMEFDWGDAEYIDPLDPPESWDYEADVVVVGAGAGGLFASAYLADNDLSVICLEADSKLNGTSEHASYCKTLGGIPSLYGEWGAISDPFDENAVFEYYRERSNYTIDPDVLMSAIRVVPPAYEWLIQEGLDIVDVATDWGLEGKKTGSVCLRGSFYPEGKTMADYGYVSYVLPQRPLMNAIAGLGKEKGVDFHTSTPVTGLVYDGERVVGVRAEENGGDAVFVKANKAVTIHAGDFSHNRALMLLYTPTIGRGVCNVETIPNNDGALTRMCLALGADMTGFDTFSVRDGTVDMGNYGNPLSHSMYKADDHLLRQPWLKFNVLGERTRWFDYTAADAPKDENVVLWGECASVNQALATAGQREIVVFDDKWHESVKVTGSPAFGAQAGRLYVDVDEAPCPFMGDQERCPETSVDYHFEDGVAASIESGYIKKADTLEELADLLEIDFAILKKNVDEWNSQVAAGSGDALHGYTAAAMGASGPIDTPPYYGARTGASTYTLLTGIRINGDGQVLGKDFKPIAGLYAGFHTAGGLAGNAQNAEEPLYSDVGTSMCGGAMCAQGILANE